MNKCSLYPKRMINLIVSIKKLVYKTIVELGAFFCALEFGEDCWI
jgi:hypothetical protein